MLIKLNINEYDTQQIKTAFDTAINEFLIDDSYDYMPGPQLTITTPAPGSILYTGRQTKITWSHELAKEYMPKITLEYSIDEKNWNFIGDKNGILTEASSYPWQIPLDLENGTTYKLRIKSITPYNGNEISYVMPVPFSISTKYISVQPLGNIDITANLGQTVAIKWKANAISEYIKIELLNMNTGDVYLIEKKYYTDNTSVYLWTVDNIPKMKAGYISGKIKITDADDIYTIGISDAIFTILTPIIYDVVLSGNNTASKVSSNSL